MSSLERQFEANILTTNLDAVVNWSRKSALWPMTFGLACCAIEMIATCSAPGSELDARETLLSDPLTDGNPPLNLPTKGTIDFRSGDRIRTI